MKHEFSLASKLATLDVGHSLILEDDSPLMGPTQMERQVTNVAVKSAKLKGRRFTTTRGDMITVGRRHIHVLRVERVE